ncbi:ATP-binding protein [Nonomuraea sp. NPDC050643]|uniref:ATP-binding protein n=1 Tax=Nonomuraea sp. NPDC050643 TaxID=3155660 RepID=UPI0033D3C936
MLPHVFGRFARGDGSRSRVAGGSGHGLAIVSAVAAAHGGRVEVSSVPGNTVFTLGLPHPIRSLLAKAAPPTPTSTAATRANAAGARNPGESAGWP